VKTTQTLGFYSPITDPLNLDEPPRFLQGGCWP
jgi:hypothetical protein